MDAKAQELIEEQKLFWGCQMYHKMDPVRNLLNCFWYTTCHKSKSLGECTLHWDQYWYHNEVFGKTILFKILLGFSNVMFYPMEQALNY